jgi:hypothetical protein
MMNDQLYSSSDLNRDLDAQALAHHLLIEGIIAQGHAPRREHLAREMGIPVREIEALYRGMAENHALVLHPHEPEPWIIHPFSLSPTATWVEYDRRGWWAPCMWCAFGILALASDDKGIVHTRLQGEAEALDVLVDGDNIAPADLIIHFSVQPRHAWDNVHHTCATCLPFRSEAQIDQWSRNHDLSRGQGVPIKTLARFARTWYSRHRDRHWRKWSVDQAQAVFDQFGMIGPFWSVGVGGDRY